MFPGCELLHRYVQLSPLAPLQGYINEPRMVTQDIHHIYIQLGKALFCLIIGIIY